MEINKRKEELKGEFSCFKKDGYTKRELLDEIIKCQDETATIAYGLTDNQTYKRRFWDVEDYLIKLSNQNKGVAKNEIAKFVEDGKFLTNEIKKIKSGDLGERKAFRSLDTLMCNHRVLRNIELGNDEHHTEIDAIVLTEKTIFIIEVKNTKKNIFINEHGNFYRVSDEMRLDQNIGMKMNDKEFLLRDAIEKAGIKNVQIQKLVVFTNYEIEVNNEYPYITTCFLSDMPHIINRYSGSKIYTDKNMKQIETAILDASCEDYYPEPMDMEAYKENLAVIIAKLECQMDKLSRKPLKRIWDYFMDHTDVAVAVCGAIVCVSRMLYNNK